MKVGILFGGRSYEREISVITAVEAASILKGSAEIYPIYAEDGEFNLLKGEFSIESYTENRLKRKKASFGKHNGRGVLFAGGKKIEIDCMLMCCHGGEGENGAFSALMEIYGIPYTASSVASSAVTMDKRLTKIVAEHSGFSCARAVWGRRGEDLPERAKSLKYPLIVKPARLGSSIGIEVAHDETELIRAIGTAFSFDEDVIVEEIIEEAVELNCAAFTEKGEIVVSGVENPRSWHEFLTFDEKYRGGKYKSGARLVKGELAERVKVETEKIYRAFELFGIARVDFLYSEKKDSLYLNEINSQPGSLAYYLFEEVGIDFRALLLRVSEETMRRERRKDIISFNSGVLQNLSASAHK